MSLPLGDHGDRASSRQAPNHGANARIHEGSAAVQGPAASSSGLSLSSSPGANVRPCSSTTPDAAMQTLRSQYFALVPPYLLHIPPAASLRAHQAALVELATTTCPPQPEDGYRKKFWKRLIAELESAFAGVEEDEVDERIYDAFADAMAAPGSMTGMPAPSPKTFVYTSPTSAAERRITLYEEQVAVQAGTTGLRTWTAALHFAHHFLADAARVFGKKPSAVVELGAGTGFLSAVLALEGVNVIATDLGDGDEEEQSAGERQTPLGRLRDNLKQNNLAIPALPLDWADAALSPQDRSAAWGQVLAPLDGERRDVVAADVIYDPDIVPLLVEAIRVLLTENVEGEQPVAVLAATVRNEETFKLFLDTCASNGLSTELLALAPMDTDKPTFWDTALDRGTRVEIVRLRTLV